jgi:hypothetical protein
MGRIATLPGPCHQSGAVASPGSHIVLAEERVNAKTSQEFADRVMYAIGAVDSLSRALGMRPDPCKPGG